jgi:glycogen synthase
MNRINFSMGQAESKVERLVEVGREYGQLGGDGGMKDALAGHAKAAAGAGIETHVVLPYYKYTQEYSFSRCEGEQAVESGLCSLRLILP